MQLGLNGRNALVCGGSKGLGFACAKVLIEEGCKVVIVSRSADNLVAAVKSLGGSNVEVVCSDLSTREGVANCIKKAERLGSFDILINNTGGPKPGSVTEFPDESWDQAHDALFYSQRKISEHFVKGMRHRGWGRIITITSIVAAEPASMLALSSVYRAAVHSYIKLLAKEVAAHGVTVNAVMPGSYLTARMEELISKRAASEGKSFEEMLRIRQETLSQKRFSMPEELGALVAFLASDRASAITGSCIAADGGTMVSL